MAFITYILLAGMALGIQKRWVIFPHIVYIMTHNSYPCITKQQSKKRGYVSFLWRFSPEVLGLCASTALVWMIIEVLVMLLSLYLMTVHSDLSTFDLIAYSGYKYVG